jgi:hypothetical protein
VRGSRRRPDDLIGFVEKILGLLARDHDGGARTRHGAVHRQDALLVLGVDPAERLVRQQAVPLEQTGDAEVRPALLTSGKLSRSSWKWP